MNTLRNRMADLLAWAADWLHEAAAHLRPRSKCCHTIPCPEWKTFDVTVEMIDPCDWDALPTLDTRYI